VGLTIAVVGKPRHRSLAAAIEDYEARAARYWTLDIHEVKEEPARGGLGEAVVRQREGERLRARIPSGARVIACAIGGTRYTSEAFSAWLGRERDTGRSMVFLIGGAYGLSDDLVEAATSTLALAPWTLPHELARLVLAEQLYRAGSILRGEPYHK
jgi:23S rRNA (pseudouridine1915-N3)-methyltransferase